MSFFNLDSVKNLQLLVPIGPLTLHNSIDIGSNLKPVTVGANIELTWDGRFENKFRFSIGVSQLQGVIDVVASLHSDLLGRITLGEFVQPACLISTFDAFEFPVFDVRVDGASLSIDCISCTTPYLLALEQDLKSDAKKLKFKAYLEDMVNNSGLTMKKFALNMLNKYKDSKGCIKSQPLASPVDTSTNAPIPYVPDVHSSLNPPPPNTVAEGILTLPKEVPSGAEMIGMTLAGVGGLFLLIVVAVLLYRVYYRQLRKDANKPLILSDKLSWVTRISVPILIVVNIALFSYSIFDTLGASVDIKLVLLEETIYMPVSLLHMLEIYFCSSLVLIIFHCHRRPFTNSLFRIQSMK